MTVTLPPMIYVNVYPPFAAQVGVAYATRELADQMASTSRLACVEIDMVKSRIGDNVSGVILFKKLG